MFFSVGYRLQYKKVTPTTIQVCTRLENISGLYESGEYFRFVRANEFIPMYSLHQYVLINKFDIQSLIFPISDASQCIDCPLGHYCPWGTQAQPRTQPLPCQPGTYNPDMRTGHPLNCRKCDPGRACPYNGLVNATLPCNEGKKNCMLNHCVILRRIEIQTC